MAFKSVDMKLILFIAAAVLFAIAEPAEYLDRPYSDFLQWTTENVPEEQTVEDFLNTDSPFFIYSFKNFSMELFDEQNVNDDWNTPILRAINSSGGCYAGVIFDPILVERGSGTKIVDIESWAELEDAFAEDFKTVGDRNYCGLLVKPEFVGYAMKRATKAKTTDIQENF
ncbi:hypothetical protein L596_004353 [Steinernema carpocapsae]|uniref:Uncharacterized protein n=1 Tax=Steinernema carpocapsae TaxID=34508 RepID=A0A4U8UZN4_STECR|nr:hypothetical protein L596_004353 [Steinernema carpocapsae]